MVSIKRVDISTSFYRVRFRDPHQFESYRVPQWTRNIADSIARGSLVIMGESDGIWKVQSVAIPRARGRSKSEAIRLAKEIYNKIEG